MGKGGAIGRILVIGLAMVLAACTTRGGSIPYNVADFHAPDAPKLATVDSAYKLSPLDTVTVAVFQVPDLSHDYVVDQSGRITMPLVGRVDAVGLSTNQLSDVIAKKLDEKYLRNPNVTVSLKETSQVVTVDGSVRQAGVFPMTHEITLLQAVALARGTDDLANPHRVAIFRVIDGQRKAAAFDLVSIRRGQAKDPTVYAGDLIIVDGSGIKSAQRQLLQSVPLASIFMAL